jgi:heme-degrading monooxygenase HmoA
MFSVIFEVLPAEGRKDEYLDLAKHLKPIIETIDGFVDNERFESLRRPGWILSHSTWRDEKSVVRWRTEAEHHATQAKGRFDIFRDYHLWVGDVTADTAPPKQAPILERRFDETETGAAKVMTFTEIPPREGSALVADVKLLPAQLGLDVKDSAVVDHDIWASIYNPGKMALLVAWIDAKGASTWKPKQPDGVKALRHRSVRVIRNYGRFDRREAPQYYPDVKGGETKHAAPAGKVAAG